MTTLAICRPRADADMPGFGAHLAAELEALRDLKRQGVLREAYSPGRPGAVLIFDTDMSSATRLIAGLPLALAGLLDVELLPLTRLDL